VVRCLQVCFTYVVQGKRFFRLSLTVDGLTFEFSQGTKLLHNYAIFPDKTKIRLWFSLIGLVMRFTACMRILVLVEFCSIDLPGLPLAGQVIPPKRSSNSKLGKRPICLPRRGTEVLGNCILLHAVHVISITRPSEQCVDKAFDKQYTFFFKIPDFN
jgi:hypothetical protein